MSRRLAEDTDGELLLQLLKAVETEERLTQRRLADSLGIALGLTNAYLKRCARKGWVRIRRVKPNRYRYFLTPQGFSEKTRLSARYLAGSLKYLTTLRLQLEQIYRRCDMLGHNRVVIIGAGELAELARLCAKANDIEIAGVIDADRFRTVKSDAMAEIPLAADAAVVVDLGEITSLLTALAPCFTSDEIHLLEILSGDEGRDRDS